MKGLYRIALFLLVVLCVSQFVNTQEKRPEKDDEDGVTVEEDETEARTGRAVSKTSNKDGWIALTRGIWDNFRSSSPVFLALSVAMGAFLGSFLLASPLSPFPVPPLPGPPVGRFPPYQQAYPVPALPSSYGKDNVAFPNAYQRRQNYGRNAQNLDSEDVSQRSFNSSSFKELMDNYEAKQGKNDTNPETSVDKNNGISEAWSLAIRTLTEFLVNLQKRTALNAESSKTSNHCADEDSCNGLDNSKTTKAPVGT